MKVTASIVTYKTPIDDLVKASQSFLRCSLKNKLFVVDNSPTDKLRECCTDSHIEYIFNPSNPGFGAAHNIAIKKALGGGSQYHLVLNPDVYFKPGTLESIVKCMDENLEIGNLMPKVFYPNNSLQYLCKLLPTPYDWIGRRFNPFKSIVDRRNEVFELKFTGYDRIMEVPYLSGCFMFLRTSALQQVGLFDENIFMYGEEADLCRRLIRSRYKTVFYPEVEIIHKFEKGSHKSLKLTWIGIKSAVYYFNKWGWIFDSERTLINAKTLKRLGYRG